MLDHRTGDTALMAEMTLDQDGDVVEDHGERREDDEEGVVRRAWVRRENARENIKMSSNVKMSSKDGIAVQPSRRARALTNIGNEHDTGLLRFVLWEAIMGPKSEQADDVGKPY